MTPDGFIDADVIVRFLAKDDASKQERSASLIEKLEKKQTCLATPLTTIADVVYVLSSPRLYRVPRRDVTALLTPIVRLPGLKIAQRQVVLWGLDLFANTTLDFGDAMIIASMHASKVKRIYSYDEDYDGIANIERCEP